jgi:hypothetical protein
MSQPQENTKPQDRSSVGVMIEDLWNPSGHALSLELDDPRQKTVLQAETSESFLQMKEPGEKNARAEVKKPLPNISAISSLELKDATRKPSLVNRDPRQEKSVYLRFEEDLPPPDLGDPWSSSFPEHDSREPAGHALGGEPKEESRTIMSDSLVRMISLLTGCSSMVYACSNNKNMALQAAMFETK